MHWENLFSALGGGCIGGDIMILVEEYHECTGWCSVHWGYHECTGKYSVYLGDVSSALGSIVIWGYQYCCGTSPMGNPPHESYPRQCTWLCYRLI